MTPTVKKSHSKKSQAARIIERFGGARRLAEALSAHTPLQLDYSTVYRWLYSGRTSGSGKLKGTGGYIPSKVLPHVIRAARMEGVFLTPDDLYPGER